MKDSRLIGLGNPHHLYTSKQLSVFLYMSLNMNSFYLKKYLFYGQISIYILEYNILRFTRGEAVSYNVLHVCLQLPVVGLVQYYVLHVCLPLPVVL